MPGGPPYDDVLLATDRSAAAQAAIPHAVDLAGRHDARLHALYVADTSGYATPRDDDREVIPALRREGERAVREVVNAATDVGVPADGEVREGTPHEAIVDYTESNDVDVVVMGTHGRSGIGDYLLGSVTERVVRTAPVPVLTVGVDEADEGE